MKKFVTLLLCMLPISLFAQVNDGIRQAMDNYDYETVVMLIESDCQDSLLLITKAQALKAMNRYPEAHRGIELSYLERQHKTQKF